MSIPAFSLTATALIAGAQPATQSPDTSVTAATIALAAVATLALVANVYLAWLTRRAVTAAEDEVREAQRTREADCRPWLVYGEAHTVEPHPPRYQVRVRNMGRGPALNAFAAYSDDGQRLWFTVDAVNIAVDESKDLFLPLNADDDVVIADIVDRVAEWTYFCEDQFGLRHRFHGAQHDEWRPGERKYPWVAAWDFHVDTRQPIARRLD